MSLAPTPLDLILTIAQNANTEYAQQLVRDIRELLDTGAAIEPWSNAVQLARDLGAIGSVESYYLIDIMTEEVIGSLTDRDEILVGLRDQMDAIELEHDLGEDESFYLDDAPPEWLALNRQWDRRFQDLHVELLRRIGEPGIANDIVLRPDENSTKVHEGWQQLLEIPEDEQET